MKEQILTKTSQIELRTVALFKLLECFKTAKNESEMISLETHFIKVFEAREYLIAISDYIRENLIH